MRAALIFILSCISCAYCKLWPKGIVHYNINGKDYDVHSQDVIMATFGRIEREVCVKFFNTPMNYSANVDNKILYISNPEKEKDCPPKSYDYSKSVVDLVIGYKCLNDKEIARVAVEMLKASVALPDPANKLDLVKQYQSMIAPKPDSASTTLLSPEDRNFLNAYYHTECTNLNKPSQVLSARRTNADISESATMSTANWNFYNKLLWPYGVVMFSVDPSLRDTPEYVVLKLTMTHIEWMTNVLFLEDYKRDDVLTSKNMLYFAKEGAAEPALGMVEGNQTINLFKMTHGSDGHTSHLLNNLMRTLGVPMMSNRYDRDNYVFVNWGLVDKGKEYLLERMPEDAWIQFIPYDFDSATHAPVNYLCSSCTAGAQTVQPQQDHLWQRTLAVGHQKRLGHWDVEVINLLYSQEIYRFNRPNPRSQ